MIKCCVFRTTEWDDKQKREFKSLENAIKTLQKETGINKYIIHTGNNWFGPEPGINYNIEIYDGWRE